MFSCVPPLHGGSSCGFIIAVVVRYLLWADGSRGAHWQDFLSVVDFDTWFFLGWEGDLGLLADYWLLPWICATASIYLYRYLLRSFTVSPSGCCPACDYDLRGNPHAGTCPECGRTLAADERRAIQHEKLR